MSDEPKTVLVDAGIAPPRGGRVEFVWVALLGHDREMGQVDAVAVFLSKPSLAVLVESVKEHLPAATKTGTRKWTTNDGEYPEATWFEATPDDTSSPSVIVQRVRLLP